MHLKHNGPDYVPYCGPFMPFCLHREALKGAEQPLWNFSGIGGSPTSIELMRVTLHPFPVQTPAEWPAGDSHTRVKSGSRVAGLCSGYFGMEQHISSHARLPKLTVVTWDCSKLHHGQEGQTEVGENKDAIKLHLPTPALGCTWCAAQPARCSEKKQIRPKVCSSMSKCIGSRRRRKHNTSNISRREK